VPGLAFQLESYAGKVKALSIVWFVYAALLLAKGLVGMAFANAFLSGHLGPWAQGWTHGPWSNGGLPPEWMGPVFLRFAWVVIVTRTCLALAVGWGLWERSSWGRIVAIVAAFLILLHFPIGTALAIWTLVVLMGYRNATLYDQL
jgi:hypothetical protein